MSKRFEMDMTTGNLGKKILLFTLPLMFTSILQLLFNACDIIVIGRFRDHTALSAISSTGALINLITNLFIGLSVGSNIVMARCYGSKDREKAEKVAHTSVVVSLVAGIFIGAFGFVFAKNLLLLMGSPSDVIDLAAAYVRIYFVGMPFNLLYNFGSALLRAGGDTKRPLIYLSIAGVFNIGANLLFVLGFGMSTDGVAYATVISQIISSVLVLLTLIREKNYCHISLKSLKADRKILWEITRIGLPAGLQGTLFSLSNVIIQSSINFFGSYVMAGNGAASNIEGFIYVCMNAFYHAALSFTSQNMGAKQYENIRKINKYCLYYVLLFGGVLGVGALSFRRDALTNLHHRRGSRSDRNHSHGHSLRAVFPLRNHGRHGRIASRSGAFSDPDDRLSDRRLRHAADLGVHPLPNEYESGSPVCLLSDFLDFDFCRSLCQFSSSLPQRNQTAPECSTGLISRKIPCPLSKYSALPGHRIAYSSLIAFRIERARPLTSLCEIEASETRIPPLIGTTKMFRSASMPATLSLCEQGISTKKPL